MNGILAVGSSAVLGQLVELGIKSPEKWLRKIKEHPQLVKTVIMDLRRRLDASASRKEPTALVQVPATPSTSSHAQP